MVGSATLLFLITVKRRYDVIDHLDDSSHHNLVTRLRFKSLQDSIYLMPDVVAQSLKENVN